ncbi:MAG: Flp pilus assembly pilin Flp, partial [Planctomycetota bacterium]
RDFAGDEEGASTVEMVILMAASISLSLAVMDKVTDGVENLSNDISSFLSDYEISTSFDNDPEPSGNDG